MPLLEGSVGGSLVRGEAHNVEFQSVGTLLLDHTREVGPLARRTAADARNDGYLAERLALTHQFQVVAQHLPAQITLKVVCRLGMGRFVGKRLGAAHDILLEKRLEHHGARARALQTQTPLGAVGKRAAAHHNRVFKLQTRKRCIKTAHISTFVFVPKIKSSHYYLNMQIGSRACAERDKKIPPHGIHAARRVNHITPTRGYILLLGIYTQSVHISA